MEDFRDTLKNNNTIQPIEAGRKIYIYSHPDYPEHKGYLKIGETKNNVEDRIDQQNKTANVNYEIVGEYEAQDIKGNYFHDKEIHQILEKEYERKKDKKTGRLTEWFKISEQDARRVIENRIYCRFEFAYHKDEQIEFKLRPNQEAAVEKTYRRWEISKQHPEDDKLKEFLWNAKPRFGKTITAYEFAKKIEARKVLIITQRTAISDSWFNDYNKFLKGRQTGYIFGSFKENVKEDNENTKSKAHSKKEIREALKDNEDQKIIFYISFSDIKGKDESGNFKKNNAWIFEIDWDLLIIDETHEGSLTDKAKKVYEGLNYGFLLHLSGTPFKRIEMGGYSEKNSYSWSYTDEQYEKENWDYSRGKNPYEEMPRLNIYAYQLSLALRRVAISDEKSFDFREFFKITSNKNLGDSFVHDAEIDLFLDNLCLATNKDNLEGYQTFPFGNEELRDSLRHTFWLLPKDRRIVRLLGEKLKKHHFFKDYKIIVATGSDDKEAPQDSMKALRELRKKIGEEPHKTKTITLSLGMLTTGVTVKEWTAVLMLNDAKSAEQYIQASFRAQTPWKYQLLNGEIYKGKDQKNEEVKTYTKENAYVFDFSPDRVLEIIPEYANLEATGATKTAEEQKRNLNKLRNFLPVISIDDECKMRCLDSNEILELRKSVNSAARDVVDSGFMLNKLFTIRDIFHISDRNRNILNRMIAVKPDTKRKIEKPGAISIDGIEKDIYEEYESNGIKGRICVSESELGERKYEVETFDDNGKEMPYGGHEISIDNLDNGLDSLSISKEEREAFERIKEREEENQKRKKDEESKVRDRLRGFARTIPMLLMAYGKSDTNLDNFHKFVSKEVFIELTGISDEDFKSLRDEGLFNESVFNAAIKHFLKRKKELGKYFEQDKDEDIFDYIPPQQTNQIFTPKTVINQMLDILEQENPGIFKNPHIKFFDPNMKSGQYITEIAKRLYRNSKDKDINRIIKDQLFGFAPTKILTDITHEMIFGWADFKEREKLKNNFPEVNLLTDIKEPNGLRDRITEVYGEDMKFDVIIGNPPYQENDNGVRENGMVNASASPIYQYFVDEAKKISKIQCFVIPSRWMSGAGKGLKKFSLEMLEDHSIKRFKLFLNPKDVFPDNDVKGGICYFVRDNTYSGKTNIEIKTDHESRNYSGFLLNPNSHTFIPFKELSDILEKVSKKEDFLDNNFQKIVSVRKPYGLSTDFLKNQEKYQLPAVQERRLLDTDLEIFGLIEGNKSVIRYIPKDYPLPKKNLLNGWKVFISKAYGSGAFGEKISTFIVCSPMQLCTETYLQIGKFKTENEAESCLKYIKTKFFRAMIGILKTTQDAPSRIYDLVPLQNFTNSSDIDWTKSITDIDKQLYKKYGLSEKEISFIEEKVKEMN